MKNKLPAFLLAVTMSMSLFAMPAVALEYAYEGEIPGQNFYTSTSDKEAPIENSGNLTIASDGTVSGGTSNNLTNQPINGLKIDTVGDFPDAWGSETDIAIAQNSIFPNALAPTTQQSGIPGYIQYDPVAVSSGALPTGNIFSPVQGYSGEYGLWGAATGTVTMPTITSGGAIGKVSIPSVGLTRYIYEGVTSVNMRKGGAHFDCTPGWNGNVAIAGHNRGTSQNFKKLYDVKIGDKIQYTTAYGTRTYQVTSVCNPSTVDVSGLYQDGINKITLYTCVMNNPEIKYCVTAEMI